MHECLSHDGPHFLQEVGPYDVGWRKRKDSWVEEATLLFIDNPVGTGFSYVEKHANLTTNNAEIVADLMAFLKGFLRENPKVCHRSSHSQLVYRTSNRIMPQGDT